MTDEIRADYDTIEQAAGKFTAQSQAAEELRQSIRSRYDELEGGGWIGRGADAFFSEMQSVIFPAFDRLIAVLADASGVSKDCGQTMRQAEQDGSGLFGT